MRTSIDCIPCFIRQTLDAARLVSTDSSIHEMILREVLHWVHEMDFELPPPALGQRIHRRLREITGVKDPYLKAKRLQTKVALKLLPLWEEKIERSADPFKMAVQLAISANVIDMGVKSSFSGQEVPQLLEMAAETPLLGDLEEFRESVRQANRILYLADNTGEIVFDRPLISWISPAKITLAVRGSAVINDATMVEAKASGICDLVEVIDNGSDAPGTILDECSAEFQALYKRADLIIAKGQGNYETLSDESENIYFLFKAKCPVIAADVGLPLGSHILARGEKFKKSGGEAE